MAVPSRRVFVIPGNGSGDILAANWYKWVRDQVTKIGIECVVRNMPDPGFLFWITGISISKGYNKCTEKLVDTESTLQSRLTN